MRIAVQMAGNPRSFKRVYPFFKQNILDTLNPDIFIHTWRLNGKERPDVVTDGSCEEYINLYKPKSFKIEDLQYDYQPMQTMVPHFTSRHECRLLRNKYEKENDIKYDVVLCHRPDVKLRGPFTLEHAKLVSEDTIWIHHFKCGIPADYLFYTTPKWMDISMDCYFMMDKLHIYQPGSERLWWHRLQEAGFKREWFRYYGNSVHDQDHVDNSYKLFDIECVR